MKAIRTRALGPTGTKGARIVASDADGNRIVVSRDYSFGDDENFAIAARALCHKMGWSRGPGVTHLAGGGFGRDMYFVFVS
jgi:hypothetical protein